MKQGMSLVLLAFSAGSLAQTQKDKTANQQYSLIEDWGLSAISIPKTSYKSADILLQVNQSELQQQFNEKPLAQKQLVAIDSQAGKLSIHGVSNIDNGSLALSSDITLDEQKAINRDVQGMNALYQLGWFSAETGIYQDQSELNLGQNFYLQSNFLLYEREHFHVSIMARFDATQWDGVPAITLNQRQAYNSFVSQKSLGLITTYTLGNAWTIHGSIKANSFDHELNPTLPSEDDAKASVGATFSF